MTSLADTHAEFSPICRDGVGIGISFELIKKVIAGGIADIDKSGTAFYIPVPLTLPGDVHLRIYLNTISQVPQVNFDSNGKLVTIANGKFEINFSMYDNGKIEPLHRYELTLTSTEAAPRVRQSGSGMQFFLDPTGPARITYGNPIWENPNFETILKNLNLEPDDYKVTERAQLMLSLGTISAFLLSLFKIDQFDSITSICKVQPPFDIGFTSEYLVLYTNIYSLEKPPCGCAAQVADIEAIEKSKFQISPIVVYISTVALKAYANQNVPRSMKSSLSSSIRFVEFSLELSSFRDDIRIQSHNEVGAGANAARLAVTTNLHASANLDARLQLGPCDIARADLASVTADLIGSNATITVLAPPGRYTASGSAVIKAGSIDFNFGGAAYPLNLISSNLEAIAEKRVREQFEQPIGHVFRVEFLELADIFKLAGFEAYGVTLESDAGTGASVMYGIKPGEG